MGLSGISPGSLILIFLIAILLFGTKRFRSIGYDLGAALRSFREGLKNELPNAENMENDAPEKTSRPNQENQ